MGGASYILSRHHVARIIVRIQRPVYHNPHCPNRSFDAGFSLVELLGVLAVLGILAILVAPSLSGQISRIKSETVLDRFAGDLYYARMAAVRSGQRVEVRLNWNADRSCVDGYDLVELNAPERVLKSVPVTADTRGVCLHVNNSGNPLVYNSRGLPHGLGTRTIVSTHGKASVRATQAQAGRIYRSY